MLLRSAGLFLGLLIWGGEAHVQAAELHLTQTDRLLILAPHPDDEVLCCGGLIQQAIEAHIPIQIVFLTYGDYNAWAFTRYHHFPVFRSKTMRAMGEVRRKEALAAADVLGIPSGALVFLGYPDYGTLSLWNAHWNGASAYESRMTRVQAVPYLTAYRPGAPYKGEAILQDLKSILINFRPTQIWVPHPADLQPDHRALYLFTQVALWDLSKDMTPNVYGYLVHSPHWPTPHGLYPQQALEAPAPFTPSAHWITHSLTTPWVKKKLEALQIYRTQWAYSHRFLTSHVRTNELFDQNPEPPGHPSPRDFDQWQVTVDSLDWVLSGRLSKNRKVSAQVEVAVWGYRRDVPFEKMPKLSLTFHCGQWGVTDQGRPIPNSGIQLKQDQREFTLRIPFQALGEPEKMMISAGITRKREPLVWNFWQILDRENKTR